MTRFDRSSTPAAPRRFFPGGLNIAERQYIIRSGFGLFLFGFNSERKGSSMTTTILVAIPGAAASRSKMAKKGWKCWAKLLSSVDSPANDGYAYHGEFIAVGSQYEAAAGDVILHVDQSSSSGVGVVMVNAAGKGWIQWTETTCADRWAGPLAKESRRLLAMTSEDRVREIAADLYNETDEQRQARGANPLGEKARAHYAALGGLNQAESAEQQATADQSATVAVTASAEANPLAAYNDEQILAEFIRRGLVVPVAEASEAIPAGPTGGTETHRMQLSMF